MSERDQFLFDVFVTALEGGINYWSETNDYHIWSDEAATVEDLDGFYANVTNVVDYTGEPVRIDASVVRRGLRAIGNGNVRIADSYRTRIGRANRANDAGEIDALDADAIVQAGLFGEVRYG